jgi:alpha-L-rhamnosidase
MHTAGQTLHSHVGAELVLLVEASRGQAYKLFINGQVVGVGPGRRVQQRQGVDAIDVLSAIRPGAANAVGIQGFHTSRYPSDFPRLLLLLDLTYADGSKQQLGTAPTDAWQVLGADGIFNPESSTGAWAGHSCTGAACSGMPQEDLVLDAYPWGWSLPGFDVGVSWSAAAAAPPFVLPFANRPARPVAVYSRRVANVSAVGGGYLLDFGRELQGGLNLSFPSGASVHDDRASRRVTLLLGEELSADGTPMVPMRTGNNFTSVWTLAPGGDAASHLGSPRAHEAMPNMGIMAHEYVEFRYALVLNAPAPILAEHAYAWVLRTPLSDVAADDYGDVPALQPAPSQPPMHRPAALATFTSDSAALQQVWGLVRHTLVACGGLDVNVDSNTRQRDFCATDAYITGLGQLALSSEPGVASMTTINGFMLDSNIWQGMTDFRAALLSLAHAHALYTADLSVVRARYEDIKKHSFVYFFDAALGLVRKPPAFMGSRDGCVCPQSWSPAGLPPGIYEAVHCTCTDLNDWPRQYQDGYQIGNVSSVANSCMRCAASHQEHSLDGAGCTHYAARSHSSVDAG